MPLLNSAILNSNTKKIPVFPTLERLRQREVGPGSLPHLHFHEGAKAGDVPHPNPWLSGRVFPAQELPVQLPPVGHSIPCRDTCQGRELCQLQEHFGGWSSAEPSVCIPAGPEMQSWFPGPAPGGGLLCRAQSLKPSDIFTPELSAHPSLPLRPSSRDGIMEKG